MIKARVAKATEASKKDAEAIREYKDQVGEYRKTVQTLHMEIDSLRSAVSFQKNFVVPILAIELRETFYASFLWKK